MFAIEDEAAKRLEGFVGLGEAAESDADLARLVAVGSLEVVEIDGTVEGNVARHLAHHFALLLGLLVVALTAPEVEVLLGVDAEAFHFGDLMVGKAHELDDVGEGFALVGGGGLVDAVGADEGVVVPEAR